MRSSAKAMTAISCGAAVVLWFLGLLMLLFNILGLWAPWHLAGFSFLFFTPVSVVLTVLAMVFSGTSKETKLVVINSVFTVISIGCVLFTFFVSGTWFW